MTNLTGLPSTFPSATGVVDTTKELPYGTRAYDQNGYAYIYLKGVASTVIGSWVTFNLNTGTTALLAANAVGPVAVATGTTVASTYGWYQIYGVATALCAEGITIDKQLYISTTNAGYCNDVDVAGDTIIGASSLAANSSSTVVVWLNHPFCNDAAID